MQPVDEHHIAVIASKVLNTVTNMRINLFRLAEDVQTHIKRAPFIIVTISNNIILKAQLATAPSQDKKLAIKLSSINLLF